MAERASRWAPGLLVQVSKAWVREFRYQVMSEDRYTIKYGGRSSIMTLVSTIERGSQSPEPL